MLSTLLKKSKTNNYNQNFKANMNNIKNTWKGIKSIIAIKNLSSDILEFIFQWFHHHKPIRNFKYL